MRWRNMRATASPSPASWAFRISRLVTVETLVDAADFEELAVTGTEEVVTVFAHEDKKIAPTATVIRRFVIA
jgi:hypothetical protein